jgi:hypothetical protein
MTTEIEIENIDELRNTNVEIGCYRDIARMTRVLRTFQKALTLAHKDGRSEQFLASIVGLHDHKGLLTVRWRSCVWETDNAVSTDVPVAFIDIERAWADEGELQVRHRTEGGFVEIERETPLGADHQQLTMDAL